MTSVITSGKIQTRYLIHKILFLKRHLNIDNFRHIFDMIKGNDSVVKNIDFELQAKITHMVNEKSVIKINLQVFGTSQYLVLTQRN